MFSSTQIQNYFYSSVKLISSKITILFSSSLRERRNLSQKLRKKTFQSSNKILFLSIPFNIVIPFFLAIITVHLEIEARRIDHKGLMETPCGGGWVRSSIFHAWILNSLSLYTLEARREWKRERQNCTRYFDMIYRGWNVVNEGTV